MVTFNLKSAPCGEQEFSAMEDEQWAIEQAHNERADRVRRFEAVPSYSKLEIYRREHRISQSDMAKLMGGSKRSYCDYESGQTAIPFKALQELAGQQILISTNLLSEILAASQKASE